MPSNMPRRAHLWNSLGSGNGYKAGNPNLSAWNGPVATSTPGGLGKGSQGQLAGLETRVNLPAATDAQHPRQRFHLGDQYISPR
jgi:hypothetical protein